MNKAQWDDLKKRINSLYGGVYLLVDGYLVSTSLQRNKMKLYVEVFVNGYINAKDAWSGKETELEQMGEIARRFHFRKVLKRSAKDIKQWEAILGKRECKKKGIYDGHIYTIPYFNSVGGFIAHIRKYNQSIEEISYEDYQARLAALEAANAT